MIKPPSSSPSPFLLSACIVVTAILLVAGLYPFNPFPRNDVAWMPAGRGLLFTDHGVIYTPNPLFGPDPARDSTPCTLYIRIQPHVAYLNGSATLLVFYSAQNPEQFRLMQYRDELLIRKNVPVKNNHFEAIDHQFKTMELELPHMFKTDQPVAFTITSDPNGAVAYRDAVRVGASPPMKLSCADFSGQLVLGDSPVSDNPWRGSVLDLSVYNSQLSAQSISNLFSNSAVNQPPEAPANNENLLAHYGFSEGSGKIIHNIAGPAPDLHIPDHFQIIHKQFLISPWQETPDKLALRDISINIFGFVPFGFLLFAYLSQCLPSRRAAVLTVIAGFAISLTIEVLQVFIPARASGITDIITNTFGAYLGMLLFRVPFMQTYAARMRTYSPPEPQAPRR